MEMVVEEVEFLAVDEDGEEEVDGGELLARFGDAE